MKIAGCLAGMVIFLQTCMAQEKAQFNSNYLLGRWTHTASLIVQRTDTLKRNLSDKVYYYFGSDGVVEFRGMDGSYQWKIPPGGNLLELSETDEQQNTSSAEYRVTILDDNRFITSRRERDKTLLYLFVRHWDN